MTQSMIGFIGLGVMGRGMALRLLEQAHPLIVCDVDEAACEAVRACGAVVAQSPREVAERAGIVFACLPSPPVSLEVALGDAGVAGGGAVRHYVECSTIGFDAARQLDEALEARGIGFVDAPVSGGGDGARAGTLSVVVAGRPQSVSVVEPLVHSLAREIVNIGTLPGQAQTAKLINNLFSSAAKTVVFEGMAMAIEAGLDLERLVTFINAGTGRNMATLEAFPDRVLRLFRSAGPTTIGIKDLRLYLAEAERAGAPTQLARLILELQSENGPYGFKERNNEPVARYVDHLKGLDAQRRQRR